MMGSGMVVAPHPNKLPPDSPNHVRLMVTWLRCCQAWDWCLLRVSRCPQERRDCRLVISDIATYARAVPVSVQSDSRTLQIPADGRILDDFAKGCCHLYQLYTKLLPCCYLPFSFPSTPSFFIFFISHFLVPSFTLQSLTFTSHPLHTSLIICILFFSHSRSLAPSPPYRIILLFLFFLSPSSLLISLFPHSRPRPLSWVECCSQCKYFSIPRPDQIQGVSSISKNLTSVFLVKFEGQHMKGNKKRYENVLHNFKPKLLYRQWHAVPIIRWGKTTANFYIQTAMQKLSAFRSVDWRITISQDTGNTLRQSTLS